MALSQKHSGLMLVPWFNSQEWRYVYQLLYQSTDINSRKLAQTILQVWKHRTPKLPSAVEGTLIIVDALLLEDDNILYENKRLSIGASIMRFLNLCCCHGDKQGTFASSVKAHNIPEWIINIRHDVAHDALLPSSQILALALDFCFGWLKTNYWEAQDRILHDYLVHDNMNLQNVQTAMSLYCQITTLCYFNKKPVALVADIKTLDRNLFRDIVRFSNEVELEKSFSVDVALSSLLEYIEMISLEANKTRLIRSIVDTAINDGGLLTVNSEQCSNVNLELARELPNDFVNVWTNLINFMCTTNMLQNFFIKLLDIVNNVVCNGLLRKVACLWILHILQRFLLTQAVNTNSSKNFLKKFHVPKNLAPFDCCDNNQILSIISTLQQIFRNYPNKFNLLFLDCFVELYERSKKIVKCKKTVVRTRLSSESIKDNVTTNSNTVNKSNKQEVVARKNCFQLVTDYSIFEGCPLGVLLSQSRDSNPWFAHEFELDH